ncbi:hypothetical protein SCP_0313320 [Sparassis crispa]|uniref:Uncharacterized protein n=1 Tax=Sparassis crispa TaxID=139825 RepID=A0A401GHK8_9APHY|nr:hypothetical protein SCP_0313320 [Sparassis crispa]GBE81603.1 hypothetical protein SCP_0313320 [Sparassis crispa]
MMDVMEYPIEELSAHPALDYIPEQIHTYDFRRSKVELVGSWYLSYDVPCIVSNHVDRDGTKLCSVLRTHPVVARSFATFPPVQCMSFEEFIGVELPDLFNPSGITVQDVADTLHAKLEEGLTVAAVAALLASELYSETCEMPNWCITEAFLRFTTLGGIFSVFAVQKVIVREDMEGHRLFYIWIEVRKDNFADTDIDGDPITSMFHWRRRESPPGLCSVCLDLDMNIMTPAVVLACYYIAH